MVFNKNKFNFSNPYNPALKAKFQAAEQMGYISILFLFPGYHCQRAILSSNEGSWQV
jgi:hypothetical protein